MLWHGYIGTTIRNCVVADPARTATALGMCQPTLHSEVGMAMVGLWLGFRVWGWSGEAYEDGFMLAFGEKHGFGKCVCEGFLGMWVTVY